MSAKMRLWTMLLLTAGSSIGFWLVQRYSSFSEQAVTAIGDYSQFAITAFATGLLFWAASRFSERERLRTQLRLFGVGIGLFALGQAIWTYYEVILATEVPYPGWPDVFFVASYLPMAYALILALLSFRRLTSVVLPMVMAVAVGAVGFGALWVVIFADIMADPEISLLEKLLGAAYPFLDIVVNVPLAVALVLIAVRMGTGRIAWPWWAVIVGLCIVAAADTAFTVTTANDTYATGSIIDLGWTLGYSTIAWGGMLAVYVHKESVQ